MDTGPNGTQTDPETGEQFTNHPAGAWRFVDNRVVRNTRFCPGGDEAPSIGGHGIVVLGADRVLIVHNTIKGNDPPAEGESAFPSSGVTILNGAEVVGVGRSRERPGGEEPVQQRLGHLLGRIELQYSIRGQPVPDLYAGGSLRLIPTSGYTC
jgi:hypothetical protein